MKISIRVAGLIAAITFSHFAWAAEGDPTPPDIWAPSGNAVVPGAGSVPAATRRGRSIAVFDPVGVGVDRPACSAVGDLLRSELTKLGNNVSPRSTMPEESCADEACAMDKLRGVQVNEALVTRISRLDQKVLIMSTLVDMTSGRAIFSDRMTAASLDDFDVLAVRVARGIDQRVPFSQTMTIDTISTYESADQKRQKSVLTTGVRIAGLVPVAQSYAGASYLYSAEIVNMYEVRQYAIETAVGFRQFNQSDNPTRVGIGTLDIGAYYHLNQMDFSPFVGGGVGLHVIGASFIGKEDKVTGDAVRENVYAGAPAIAFGGGATLLRGSDVHVVGTVRYTADLVGIRDIPVSHGLMFGLGITYVSKGGRSCCIW